MSLIINRVFNPVRPTLGWQCWVLYSDYWTLSYVSKRGRGKFFLSVKVQNLHTVVVDVMNNLLAIFCLHFTRTLFYWFLTRYPDFPPNGSSHTPYSDNHSQDIGVVVIWSHICKTERCWWTFQDCVGCKKQLIQKLRHKSNNDINDKCMQLSFSELTSAKSRIQRVEDMQ